MKLEFAVCFGFLLAALFIAITGAFIFYVPTLAIVTGVVMILGLALMYALGFQTGRRWRRLSNTLPIGKFSRHIPVVR